MYAWIYLTGIVWTRKVAWRCLIGTRLELLLANSLAVRGQLAGGREICLQRVWTLLVGRVCARRLASDCGGALFCRRQRRLLWRRWRRQWLRLVRWDLSRLVVGCLSFEIRLSPGLLKMTLLLMLMMLLLALLMMLSVVLPLLTDSTYLRASSLSHSGIFTFDLVQTSSQPSKKTNQAQQQNMPHLQQISQSPQQSLNPASKSHYLQQQQSKHQNYQSQQMYSGNVKSGLKIDTFFKIDFD